MTSHLLYYKMKGWLLPMIVTPKGTHSHTDIDEFYQIRTKLQKKMVEYQKLGLFKFNPILLDQLNNDLSTANNMIFAEDCDEQMIFDATELLVSSLKYFENEILVYTTFVAKEVQTKWARD